MHALINYCFLFILLKTFDLNFINQDFYQEMDLDSGVEGYLYDIMRYIQEKVDTIKSTEELNSEVKEI